ncbi:hypothetical protein HCUR_00040 [Holospora curviuscula]|uniref:Uncharacterized protein n=1 Tax=Holospora curviuscula TaxID=1082868 RepID=A0A2S5RHZ0_9PROT|nr:hypothetical protein HCUR_00040 [Holospora curviuscula]
MSLGFLENLGVSGHRNLFKSILPQGGAQKELLASLNAHLALKLGSLEAPLLQRKVEPLQRSHGSACLAEIREGLNAHPLNKGGMKHRTGARILLLVYPKEKAHPKEFSHHGHGVLGIHFL